MQDLGQKNHPLLSVGEVPMVCRAVVWAREGYPLAPCPLPPTAGGTMGELIQLLLRVGSALLPGSTVELVPWMGHR